MSKAIVRRSALCCTFLWLGLVSVSAQYNLAPAFTFVTNNGAITITSYISSYITGPGGEVDVPDSTNGYPVTGISSNAFGSGNPTSIVIPASVTNIGEGAFGFCPYLTNIEVNPENPSYINVDGVLFNASMSLLLQYPAGLVADSYAIPPGTTRIGAYAFQGCEVLSSVTIPDGVTSIGDGAFFYCQRLTNMVIPSGVTNIGANTFTECTSLTSVVIPASVTNIVNVAFQSCFSLTGIYFRGDAPAADVWAFYLDNSATAYYLPGKFGWTNMLSSIPIALWLPQVQGANNSGSTAGSFGLNINWASGQKVVVEATSNLINPNWQPLQTNLLTADSTFFNDSQATNYSSRFYRLRSP